MKAVAGWAIILFFIGFGLVRMGVGNVLFLQSEGLVSIGEMGEVVEETAAFFAEREDRRLIPLSTSVYFAYIAAMGVALFSGAVLVIRRQALGFGLIGLYLLMHLALFVNFLEVNPKMILLAVTVGLSLLLWLVRPPARAGGKAGV